jgi:hypothetical protein
MEKICDVDVFEPLSPANARDVLSACFNQIHCGSTGLEGADTSTLNAYCVEIVRKSFKDLGLDYTNPDKAGLIKANEFLTDFAKKFHEDKMVQEYHDKIAALINKLP